MKKKLTLITALLFGMTASAFADCGKCKDNCKDKDCSEALEAKFAEFDADKDGKLTLVEFKALAESCKKKECKEEEKGKEKAVKPAASKAAPK